MLPREYRLRRSADFGTVVRSGIRARGGHLVLHQRAAFRCGVPAIGLVVGRAVGGSVVRHRVSRRLRAQLVQRLDILPRGIGLVVRALPGSAQASSAELGADLDSALNRLTRRS